MDTETTTYQLPDDRRARLETQLADDIADTARTTAPTAEQLTDAEIADDLRELEARGFVTGTYTPARERLTAVGGGVIRECIVSGVLTAQSDLRAATMAYESTSEALVAAIKAETEARLTYEYQELDFRAKLLAKGVPGTNEPTRKVNLDLAVADDDELGEARTTFEARHAARLTAEHAFRVADQRQKALRVELAALGHLASNH